MDELAVVPQIVVRHGSSGWPDCWCLGVAAPPQTPGIVHGFEHVFLAVHGRG